MNMKIRTTEEAEMANYLITIEEPSGAIIAQDIEPNALSPMDALREYAAESGWTPEHEDLDYSQNMEYWTMTEDDGTRIIVEEIDEPS